MSNQATKELKPPTSEEINKLRDELRSLKLKGTPNSLDEATVEEILLLPPSVFFEAVRGLTLAFGPLSTFPALEYPFAAIASRDEPQSRRPNPIIDDGASFLEDALTALVGYNKLLEDKVAKFSVQSVRSIATLRESSASNHDITSLDERTTETKLHKSLHEQQIAILRQSSDSHDKNRSLRLEEYDRLFYDEILFLNCFDTLFDKNYQSAPREASPWSEYDYVLQHIERWRHLVNVDSYEGEATINRAQEHVQLANVFQENIVRNVARSDHRKVVHDEAADIIKEIDWLWEEVVPVAHMSVSAQFLRPVLTRFKNWKDSKNLREAIVTTYVRPLLTAFDIRTNQKKVSGVLRFMNDRLSAVAERTQILVYHHQALHNVAQVRQLNETSSPVGMVTGHVPHTLAHKTQSHNMQLQNQQSTASDKLRAFMQVYGAIPIHVDDPFPRPTPSLLDEYVQNRAYKGDTLLQDLHKLFEAAAKSGLTDQELGGELLLESLLADSAASPIHPGSVYKDTQLEGSIEILRGQAKHIQEMFKDLKLEGPAMAPDYVAHAYRRTADQLPAKVGERCFKGGDNPNSACRACIRCLKFEEFVRKWGC
ncbi:hypothetical protein E0Z10_g1075 [Xylaria hypoxylon]|uniref:Uncharacterized protein n=1 Tax=Xylaria hypoxylon TaxID=37992 RepID=A0A4Z0YUR5_9PEZI|nr:hypothetical protein E0Z10_g1075 [Xylaria hypoxylon]